MTMPFKKLHSDIQEKLVFFNITAPTPFQTASIPIIKSGTNVYCTAPKDSGKTTTLVLTTLQKLKCDAHCAQQGLIFKEILYVFCKRCSK